MTESQDAADLAEASARGVSVEALREARTMDLKVYGSGQDRSALDALAAARIEGRRVVSLEEWAKLTRRDSQGRPIK